MKLAKLILFVISILIFISSCSHKEGIKIIGFTKIGDKVTIKNKDESIFVLSQESQECRDSICYLNREIKIFRDGQDVKLHVLIEVQNTTLLDTFVIIPKSNKKPFISFLSPTTGSGNRRYLFIGDEAGKYFFKE